MIELPIWVMVCFLSLFIANDLMYRRQVKRREQADEKFMRARRGLLQAHESLRVGRADTAREQILEAWADIALLEGPPEKERTK